MSKRPVAALALWNIHKCSQLWDPWAGDMTDFHFYERAKLGVSLTPPSAIYLSVAALSPRAPRPAAEERSGSQP